MGKDTIEVCDKSVAWSYEDYGYNAFDQKTSDAIEQAYQKNPNGSTTVTVSNGQTYNISFSDMKQVNTSSKYKRNVQRKEQKTNVRKVDVSELRTLFAKYAKLDETEENGIGGEGIMQFAEDVNIDPMQIDLLVLFWKLKLSQAYFISEEQWIQGMAYLGMETLSKMKKQLPKLKNELDEDDDQFIDFYMFCFRYMKQPDQKSLGLESAVATWKLIMKNKYKYIDEWCTFVENELKHSITPDTWRQFLEFTKDATFKSFATFDLSMTAYPSAIDEFVEYMQQKEAK